MIYFCVWRETSGLRWHILFWRWFKYINPASYMRGKITLDDKLSRKSFYINGLSLSIMNIFYNSFDVIHFDIKIWVWSIWFLLKFWNAQKVFKKSMVYSEWHCETTLSVLGFNCLTVAYLVLRVCVTVRMKRLNAFKSPFII